MNKSNFFAGQPIFSQLFKFIPPQIISKCIRTHNSDRYYKKFDTRHHLITMLYCCYQNCTSLREVVTGMGACEGKLQSLGVNYLPTRSTISDANKNRTHEVFGQIFYELASYYRAILPDSRMKDEDEYLKKLIILDSTTIGLFKEILKSAGCKDRNGKRKGGIKVHMAVQAQEDIPYFIRFTSGASADAPFMKYVNPPKGSIVVMDKAYNNFHWLNRWKKAEADWVTRKKNRTVVEVKEILPVSDKDKAAGIISDELVIIGTPNKQVERVECRQVVYFDAKNKKQFEFITSATEWEPLRVAAIYKQRWQIELIFKRLKQNMPLYYFLGDNENALKIQIFCALISDLLLKIATKTIKRKWAFSTLASFVRLHLMNYTHLQDFLNNPDVCRVHNPPPQNYQLSLNLSG